MKTYTLLLLLLGTFSCGSQTESCQKNDLVALNLKGNIKSVVVKNYLADERNGQFVKGPQASQLFKTFNKNGNLLKSVGGYTNEVERHYNDKGLLVEEINFWDSQVVRRHEFSYDDLDREKQILIFGQSGKLEQKRVFFYGANGEFVETKFLDGKNHLLSRSVSTNDELGREIKREYFNNEDQSEIVLSYLYDDEGRKILDQSIGQNEKENSLQRFVYNEEGNTIQNTIKTWYEDTIIEYNYVKFDEYGNWIVRYSKEKREKGKEPKLIPRSYEERVIAYY